MSTSARAQAHLVISAARALAVPLPAEFTAQLDDGARVVAAAEAIPRPYELTARVLDALAAGRDYHTDKQVQAMLLDCVLVGQLNVGGAAVERADMGCGDALTEHADSILTAWADSLDAHGAALLAAAAVLPADLTATDAIVKAGAEAMTHWAAAQTAIKLFRVAVDGFAALATTARVTVVKKNPAIVTRADVATLGEAEATAMREGRPVDVWMLARHQAPLRLATLQEYQQRVAAHEQQRQAAALAYEEQRQHKREATLA